MDEELTAVRSPHGIVVRYFPPEGPGLWHEVIELPGNRLGLAVGRSVDQAGAARSRSAVRQVLRNAGDSLRVSETADGSGATAVLWGVIDRTTSVIACIGRGDTAPLIAEPGARCRTLRTDSDETITATLAPGATVLLCTAMTEQAAELLDGCSTAHPDHAADHLIGSLGSSPGLVALFYRHPPPPLELTVMAEPASLATIRSNLRQWLALAGVDAEPAADVLLAVGEAASNAAEHAVIGASGGVRIQLWAEFADNGLHLTVSDDGVWKSPDAKAGFRGHGLKLIDALVDTADLTTGELGTTVTMRKELSR